MTPEALLSDVAALFGLSVDRLRSRNRTRYVAQARQAAAWVLRQAFPVLSLSQVGELLGGRDHTTIIHSVSQVEDRMDADPELRSDLLALIERCRGRSDAPAVPVAPKPRPADDRRFWGVRVVSAA